VSPDGRWIVWVQAANGQLMRPDSKLFIVPAAGGRAREMRCNTPLMNSWHSFSPNGRWMVFATKSRTPYTRMMLTHLDEDGNDTPPVLVEDAAEDDRAINLPEFVNIGSEGLLRIDVPAAEFYRWFDTARDLEQKGRLPDAIEAWRKALALDPDSAKARTNLGIALWKTGRVGDALAELREAVRLKPSYPEARNNLGIVLVQTGAFAEAIVQLRAALRLRPEWSEVRHNLEVAEAARKHRPGSR
jgi:tetratricopeptide (TPR) repeat protein